MQAFLQSAFLQALSQGLIASIWQMALVWCIAVICFRLFTFSASQKFNVAFAAQLSGFILFVYTFIHVYNNGNSQIKITAIDAGSILSKINYFFIEYMPYVALIYLSILIAKFSKFILSYRAAKGLRKYELKKIAPVNRIFVQEMSQLFSLKRKVNIYLSSRINCPLTVGFLKPVILIPIAAVNHLTTEQMEAVILHELAHIKRADYLLFILQNLIEKIFFFNIFSIMLSNIIERERENACDDWVLQFRYNSMHYAEALFKLGRLRALPAFAMPFTGKKESLLLARIKRLLHNTQNKTSYSAQSNLLASLSILIMAFVLISSSIKIKENNKPVYSAASTQSEKIRPVNNEMPASFKLPDSKEEQNKEVQKKKETNTYTLNKIKLQKTVEPKIELEDETSVLAPKPNYLVQVQQVLDSLNQIMPTYNRAVNSQMVVTPDVVQKAMSYQNFKQIENMLSVAGNSINIIESDASKDSYRKQITIEATDKNGNKHVYNVIVELYQ
jgi:beta-lactamase regulating signal transducer with metallopeptidase domain